MYFFDPRVINKFLTGSIEIFIDHRFKKEEQNFSLHNEE
jgi:hypothetical protein